MTGFLKMIGIWNAAAWFGAALLYVFVFSPAARSGAVETLLGEKHFPYFSGAIDMVTAGRFYVWLLVFATVALVHLLAERLYLGRIPGRAWAGLVVCLLGIVLLLALVLHPRMRDAHLMRHAVNAPAPQKEVADRAFRFYRRASLGLNLCMMAGLAAYLWRLANPPETSRFIPAGKFRANSGVDFIP